VEIGVLRNGKPENVTVALAERPDDPQRFADMVTGPDNIVDRLGIVGVTLNKEIRQSLSDLRIDSGVLVVAQTSSSTLLGDSPDPGDIIHAINGTPVKNLDELKQNLRQIKPGDSIVLQVEKDGRLSYLVMESE